MARTRAVFFALIALAALAAAGCGSTASAGGSTGGTSATGAHVATHSAMVGGKTETVLANSQGMTLYYFDPDTTTSVSCTGGCASTWPPLLGTGTPVADGSLPGTLSVIAATNGNQVTYNGHPLYTYSGDKAAGDANGDGLFGKWHVATPNVAQNPNKGSSGGYGY
jgi:predicted lipoprotein with Yx(FWY)xxD motif